MAVLITGASGGIGIAISKAFLENGFDTVLVYNSNDKSVAELEKQYPARAVSVKADVRNHSEVKAAFDVAKRVFGGVDILVNNAGVDTFGCFQLLSDSELDRVIDTNLKGTYYCCEESFSHMNDKKYGVIINISSIWGVKGASCEAAYSATKAGIIGLTQALADELAPSGIRVNCIAPGVIDTPMNEHLGKETLDELKNMTPLNRLGTPEDIAQAVLFLAGDGASFITGQTLTVDGGFLK
jgi:3-oxoacyl-[acyl-carrier protein] reductase